MKNIEYIQGGIELIDEIGILWEKLNIHHLNKSVDFKERYKNFTFDKRKEGMLKKAINAQFHIILVKDDDSGRTIGYCVSSIEENKTGEIESLYVESDYREYGIGKALMERTLQWLCENNASPVRIGVAGGNEDVFSFYKKFGFYPKMTMLEQKMD
jgi:ribosomal protein S18 acetylase RimI-like enzyme